MRPESGRWAWAEVDLDALAHNVAVAVERVAPAEVWAVVKADAYGHGVVDIANAALEAGVRGLCVALVSEAEQLRQAGVSAPILLLSQQPLELIPRIVAAGVTPTVDSPEFVDALAAALPAGEQVGVQIKIDTGMQRVGAAPAALPGLLAAVDRTVGRVRVDAVFTHLATADDPDDEGVQIQMARFDEVRRAHSDLFAGVMVHIANSAAALTHPQTQASAVRMGIALYGISPGRRVDPLLGAPGGVDLRPVMSLKARVSHLKYVEAGSSISYGWRHRFATDTRVATVPIGYADGVPRALGLGGGEVLIAGTRCAMVGVVTMDQLMVDVGHLDPAAVAVGDEVVLIGTQGIEQITATDWAALLGTIAYEVVCGISARVERLISRRVED